MLSRADEEALSKDMSDYGYSRADVELALWATAAQADAGWLYIPGVNVEDGDSAAAAADDFVEKLFENLGKVREAE